MATTVLGRFEVDRPVRLLGVRVVLEMPPPSKSPPPSTTTAAACQHPCGSPWSLAVFAGRLGPIGARLSAGREPARPNEFALTAAIDLVPGAPDSVTRRIARAAGGDEAAGQFDPPGAVLNLRRVRNIPLLVAAVVGGFAALSLGHQLLVAVRRRRRDLAVLRALGASRRSVTGVVHVQATIVTATVLLVAVPLGIAAGFGVYRPFVDRLGTRTDLEGPGWWAFLAVVALLVLANVVAGVPARRARRTSPSRTLAGS